MSEGARGSQRGPSMADVAAYAGVAIGTVSNTLNRPDLVREATRRKVLSAISELGFVRNDAARSLAAGTFDAVGLVLADIGNSFFVDIARGVDHALRRENMDVVIVNSDVDTARERHNLELFERTRMAGVILAPLDTALARSPELPTRTTPTVFANYESPDLVFSSATVDERLGGALAAGHLIAQGRTRLLFAGGPMFLSAVAERRDGALSAAAAAAGATMGIEETRGLKIADGRRLGKELIARGMPAFDGIVAASDLLAIGLIQAFRDAPGFSVPNDIAVTGYDDNHFASESDVPVTTINQRGEAIGRAAVELLLERIRQPEKPTRRIVIEPLLVPRRSTAP